MIGEKKTMRLSLLPLQEYRWKSNTWYGNRWSWKIKWRLVTTT